MFLPSVAGTIGRPPHPQGIAMSSGYPHSDLAVATNTLTPEPSHQPYLTILYKRVTPRALGCEIFTDHVSKFSYIFSFSHFPQTNSPCPWVWVANRWSVKALIIWHCFHCSQEVVCDKAELFFMQIELIYSYLCPESFICIKALPKQNQPWAVAI